MPADISTTTTRKQPTVAVVTGSGGIKTFAAIAVYELLDELRIAPDLLIVYGQDASSRDEMAAALQESEARYRSVVTSLPANGRSRVSHGDKATATSARTQYVSVP